MRVGAFARGLMLKGECEVELVLMTASKPDGALFIHLANQLPAKFEVWLYICSLQAWGQSVCVCMCVCVCVCVCVCRL